MGRHMDIRDWRCRNYPHPKTQLRQQSPTRQHTTQHMYYSFYGERNGYRMPAYHRLDIGVNLHKQKKNGKRTWSFSIYNLYSRLNPFFLYFDNPPKGTWAGEDPLPNKFISYYTICFVPL